jgi:hypothetical protein
MTKTEINGNGWLAAIFLVFAGLAALTIGCVHVADRAHRDTVYLDGARRSYTINRDKEERYSVVYGKGDIRAFMPDGTEVPVVISDAANAYIWGLSATADDLRFVTIGDDTLILNTQVVPKTKTSPDYTVTKIHKDYNALTRWSPQRNTYHSTEKDTSTNSGDYWKYTAASDGWAKWVGIRVGANWAHLGTGSQWLSPDNNPMGFKVTFVRPDDHKSFTYDARVDFAKDPPSDMHDVALRFQNKLHSLGAPDALVAWEDLGTMGGKFYITSPYRNAGATISSIAAPTGALNLTAAGRPFDGGVFSVGCETVLPEVASTEPIVDRWTRVPPPAQENAQLDETTLPMKMVLHIAPYYRDRILKYRPVVGNDVCWAYWRLGDSGSTAKDEKGSWNGSYVNKPTHAIGALVGDKNPCTSFVRTSSQYVNATTLGPFGSRMYLNGFWMECWLKTTDTTHILGVMGVVHPGKTTVQVLLNTANGTAVAADRLYVQFRDEDGHRLEGYVSSTGLTDGRWHHLAVGPYFNSKMVGVFIDGGPASFTYACQDFCDNFATYTSAFCIGAIGGTSITHYFQGQLDEVALFLGEIYDYIVEFHCLRGTHDRLLEITPVDWGFRQTGDNDTNPLPPIFTGGKPITTIALHRNRLVLGAGENVAFSQAGNFFDFYNVHDDIDSSVRKSLSVADRASAIRIAKDRARQEGIQVDGYRTSAQEDKGAYWVIFDLIVPRETKGWPAHFVVRVAPDGSSEVYKNK